MNEAERREAFIKWFEQEMQVAEQMFGFGLMPVLQTEVLNGQRMLVGAAIQPVPIPNWTPPQETSGE